MQSFPLSLCLDPVIVGNQLLRSQVCKTGFLTVADRRARVYSKFVLLSQRHKLNEPSSSSEEGAGMRADFG